MCCAPAQLTKFNLAGTGGAGRVTGCTGSWRALRWAVGLADAVNHLTRHLIGSPAIHGGVPL
ncbi:hypothetical protein HaLaN_02389, partial [Haematococcus lacustris]